MSGSKPKIIGEVTLEYLKKYPKTSTLGIAKKLFKDNPEIFHDVEHARSSVRYYRGSCGFKNRLHLKDDYNFNKYSLADSDEMELEPVFVEEKKTLIISDLHVPYHSIEALNILIDFALEYKPNAILILGDFFDFYEISRFVKDPRRRSVPEEIELGKKLLKQFQELICKKIYFKTGNHEDRLDHYIMRNAPALFGIEGISLYDQLSDLKIEVIPDKRRVRIGKLDLIHGHELFKGVYNPVNPARGLFLKTGKTCACGHAHSSSEHSSQRLNGELVTTWSVGCLCNLKQDYAPYGQTNHGFAVVDLKDNGMFSFKNYRIQNGEIL